MRFKRKKPKQEEGLFDFLVRIVVLPIIAITAIVCLGIGALAMFIVMYFFK